MIARRCLLAGALALALSGAVRADCPGAQAFVRHAGERTQAVLNARGTDDAARLAGMAALMLEVADLPLIARLVLGRHWRSADEAQRAAYLEAFRVYAMDSLAFRFSRLGGGVGLRVLERCVADGRDAQVATEVTLATRREPVRIDWRVREADGGYRLIDVAIEGVSLVVSNRSEFDAVVSRQGLDALVAQIQGKNEPAD